MVDSRGVREQTRRWLGVEPLRSTRGVMAQDERFRARIKEVDLGDGRVKVSVRAEDLVTGEEMIQTFTGPWPDWDLTAKLARLAAAFWAHERAHGRQSPSRDCARCETGAPWPWVRFDV